MSAAERLEQLRDLPRVTAADRERYKRWEQEARAELAEVEPTSTRLERAYLQAAMLRKLWLVLHRPGEGDVPITRAEWHSHWRSLSDYDGPPMRAPSGVRTLIGGGEMDLIVSSRLESADGKPSRFLAIQMRVAYPGCNKVPSDAYAPPSAGGRGWCPKLAGVSK